MTKIKICGLTNAYDAGKAESLGADFLGFVFFKNSPRFVSSDKVSEITEKLDGKALKVGLFLDQDMEFVTNAVRSCGLDLVQLHGSESPEYVEVLSKKVKVIKSFKVGPGFDVSSTERYPAAGYFLFDTLKEGMPGGTGQVFDWDIISGREFIRPIFLAGGLKPVNVREAIAKVGPFAVDVASGVEELPGKKDMKLMEEFINAAK